MIHRGVFRSLVLLRAKEGELAALLALKQDPQVQPLLQLRADAGPATERLLNRVEKVVRMLHQFGRLAMLDASDMPQTAGPEDAASRTLGELADRLSYPEDLLQPASVPFIPVIRTDAVADQVARIGRLAHELGTGCAIRLSPSMATPDRLDALLAGLGAQPADVDLILDRRYLDHFDPRLVDSVSDTLDAIGRHGVFRSITLLSGSVPKTLNQTEHWEVPRYEELLWRSVADRHASVRFGDYGVVHPISSPGTYRSKHISVKYSCPAGWFYLRERIVEPAEENSRALTVRVVSRHLLDSEHFSGASFSWGDHEFAAAANGAGSGLGSTSKPVAFATSHHLSYLASLSAA